MRGFRSKGFILSTASDKLAQAFGSLRFKINHALYRIKSLRRTDTLTIESINTQRQKSQETQSVIKAEIFFFTNRKVVRDFV